MRLNFEKDILIEDGRSYPLKDFRMWLILNEPNLVASHVIKRIIKNGRLVPTYDWQHIYFLAQTYGILKKYIHERATQ